MSVDKDTIKELSSAVFDNGRRGNPRPGCDCRQCFGYCMIDGDEAIRQRLDLMGAPADIEFPGARA
jgi:hypothetical protein